MSSVDIGTAFVKILPDTSGFQATLQKEVNVAIARIKANSVNVGVNAISTAGGGVGANAASSAAAASANLRGIEKSSEAAAKGMLSAKNESRLFQGALVGLSRVTPVAVFGLGIVGTAALAAGLAIKSSINSAADLQQQLNLFQAVTGATADEMTAVSAAATQLGGDLNLPATSAGDAATALTELAKAGLSVQDSLDAVRGVLQLGAAANLSAGEAAKITATQLNAFGLAGEKATHITDLLAGASIAAQGEISDFAAAFQQSASAAKASGVSIETTTGLLTELARAGIKGADAGTSLRTFLLRLVPTTKEAAQFQKALGIELDRNATIGSQLPKLFDQYRTALLRLPPADRIEALNQIFGQDAFRGASVFFGRAAGTLERVTAEVDKAGTGADLAKARMKGFAGSVEGLKSSAQTLGTTLGTSVLPALTTGVHVLSDITSAATGAANALKPLGGLTKPLVAGVGGGDVIAQAAFAAAAGLGIKKLLERRAASKAIAAEELVASERQVAADAAIIGIKEKQLVTQASITGAAKKSAVIQIESIGGITAALERQRLLQQEIVLAYTAEAAAAERAALGIISSSRKAATGLLSANKGLAVGLGLSVAGGFAPGIAGSILSGAGAGAIAGSFIPLPGATFVGAGVGAAVAAFSAFHAQHEKDKAAVQAEFNKLSFQEQQEFLKRFPQAASRAERARTRGPSAPTTVASFLAGNDLTLKANPFDVITSQLFTSPSETLNLSDASSGPSRAFLNFASGLKKQNIVLPGVKQEAVLAQSNQLSLNLALARLSGSTGQVTTALKAQATFDRNLIQSLQNQLTAPNKDLSGFLHSVKERTAIAKALEKAIADLNSVQGELAQTTTFTIPANLTISQIQAVATKSLGDNLAADEAIVAAYQKELAHTKATGDALDTIKIGLAQAQAQVSQDQQAISDKSAQDAKDAAQKIKDNQAAQTLLRQTILDIQSQRFANRLTAADLTPGTADNRKVLNDKLKFFQVQKTHAEKLRDAAKKGSQAQADARKQIEVLNGLILGVRTSIKNLNGTTSSFSLQDLFKAAVDQFNTFGSNIAGRNGVLSAQDERAKFGQVAAKNAGDAIAAASLTQQERQTALLESINAKLSANPQGGVPVTGNRGRIGGLTAIENADRLAVNGIIN